MYSICFFSNFVVHRMKKFVSRVAVSTLGFGGYAEVVVSWGFEFDGELEMQTRYEIAMTICSEIGYTAFRPKYKVDELNEIGSRLLIHDPYRLEHLRRGNPVKRLTICPANYPT
jgi:NADH:ubiquinone oxidoreductase subunit H